MNSMTGYGRSEFDSNGRTVQLEIKSVNHKYLELVYRLPKGYAFLEEKLRPYLQSRMARGKLDLSVTIVSRREDDSHVTLNHSIASGYLKALRELAGDYNIPDDLSLSSFSHFSDLFTVTCSPENPEEVWETVRCALDGALADFFEMRVREGMRMKEDIHSRILLVREMVTKVEERSALSVGEYQKKMQMRLQELLESIEPDDQRVFQEAALWADKTSVAEETVRLNSHLDQMELLLAQNGPVGRRLDFLTQEMNREANTIGSKAMDVTISHLVVEMKAEIEKIREQIQNVE